MTTGNPERVYRVRCYRCEITGTVEYGTGRGSAALALIRLGWKYLEHGVWVCADCVKRLPAEVAQ